MASYTVLVRIAEGRISVDKPRVALQRKDDLQWQGNEPFTIEFENGKTPFDSDVLDHARARSQNRLREGCPDDTYKYTIYSEKDRAVFLDPLVIVQPPTTP